MNPAFLDDMSWEMAEVYGAISDQILINLAHYFPYFNANNLPASSFAYQAGMLAQMGKVNADTAKIIRNGLADANSALNGVLEAAIIQSIQAVEPDLYKAARLGILKPPVTPILSPNQTRAFQLYYKQAADKLNLVNTVMLESTQQAYQTTVSDIASRVQYLQRAVDIGAGETITGVSSWNQAMTHAINRMKQTGITGFIDHAGKRWSAEAYTAMDIRTTVFNVGRSAVWEANQDFGNDLYLVSYHNGARPLCYPWQSKVISSTDHARTVTDLDGNEIHVYAQSETSYGEPAGLFGINCKHYPTPFIPGVSTIHDHQQSPEANEKTYEESQKQRQLERTLREEKRDLAMLKAQGAPKEVIDAQKARCERADERIEDFCLETGRARHRDREAVYTKRAFPSKDSYNPALFETKQRDMINSFYQNSGAQQGYKFGEMTPKEEVKRETGSIYAADETRQKILEKYDKKISRLEQKRLDLISSGSDDYEQSDKLYAEIERLEKKRAAIANGVYTVSEATVTTGPFVVNPGSTSEVQLKKAKIYTTPDGKRFVFKSGMNKAHQNITPEQLIDAYYTMPKELRDMSNQNVIAVVDVFNPRDDYWRTVYKDFTQSYMTGGEQITVWRYDRGHDLDYFKDSLRHESGHGVDKSLGWFSEGQEWADAMSKDKEYSGGAAESVSTYGKNSPKEDFADSVKMITNGKTAFEAAFPNRAKILERILWGASQ